MVVKVHVCESSEAYVCVGGSMCVGGTSVNRCCVCLTGVLTGVLRVCNRCCVWYCLCYCSIYFELENKKKK